MLAVSLTAAMPRELNAEPLTAELDGPPGEIMPLVGYSPFWLVLGITLLALIAAYYIVVALVTAKRDRPPAEPEPTEPPVDVVRLQQEAYGEVARIEAAVQAGQIDSRTAHEQLSATVRSYVSEATGIPADKMTLQELSQTPLVGTTRAVARFYPGLFAAEPITDVSQSVLYAREVLSGWR